MYRHLGKRALDFFVALPALLLLAPFLALATMITVSILSAAYSSTISAFPSGGGGYTVASSTLGRSAGMICGASRCLLMVERVRCMPAMWRGSSAFRG